MMKNKNHLKIGISFLFSSCLLFQTAIPVIAEDGNSGDSNTSGQETSEPVNTEDPGSNDQTEVISPATETLNPNDFISETNDQLLQGYLDSITGENTAPKGIRRLSRRRGNNLTGVNLSVYNQLKEKLDQIVNGELTDTKFVVSVNYDKSTFTGDDLGLDLSKQEDQKKIYTVLKEKYPQYVIDGRTIFQSLLADEPYEMYWMDKSNDESFSYAPLPACSFSYTSENGQTTSTVTLEDHIDISMMVNAAYRSDAGNAYQVDPSKVDAARTAAENAKKIVAEASNKSDYEKLKYYNAQIDNLTDYDTNAARNSSFATDDNPWQLINVFDGNENTKVVCEGYAKAFKYLCDLTKFKSRKIEVYTVTGTMQGATGAGPHMWNIVKMDDGKVYLEDATNNDTGSVGSPEYLFLAGTKNGNYRNGYIITIPKRSAGENSYYPEISISYAYDDETLKLYSQDELTLADSNYEYDPNRETEPETGTVTGSVTSIGSGSSTVALYSSAYQGNIAEDIQNGAKNGKVLNVESAGGSGSQYAQKFSLNDVEDGSYKLAVYKPGYLVSVTDVTVDGDTDISSVALRSYGDVNHDGQVNISDILAVRNHVIGKDLLTGEDAEAANVPINGEIDKNIDIRDILQIRDRVIGKVGEDYSSNS